MNIHSVAAPGLRGEAHWLQAGDHLLSDGGPQPNHRLEENEQVSEDDLQDFLLLSLPHSCRTMTELEETSPTLVIESLSKARS